MEKTCQNCKLGFSTSDSELRLLEKVSPAFGGKTHLIPPPTLCPECRQQRRLAHRNERNLYYRTCDSTGKRIVSIYSPEAPFVVYNQEVWWADSWNPLDYGRDFDFSRPFFEQFTELRKEVPRMALLQSNNENSAYTNCVSHLKDCYLMSSSDFNRDCAYGAWVQKCQDSYDNLYLDTSELTYQTVFSDNIYAGKYLALCSHCSDSAFLFDCRSCSNCFMSFGLREKQYYFNNEPCSKEEYQRRIEQVKLNSYEGLTKSLNHYKQMCAQAARLYMRKQGRVLDSTGDCLTNVENCIECFEIVLGKDCTHVQSAYDIKDTADCSYVMGELGYENCECFPQPFQSAFNVNCYSGNNIYYSDTCMNSCSDIFGCIGVKHGSYCILNKQYSKEEYELLVPKIISHMKSTGEWGEFLPIHLSPFGYNETNAWEEFPLQRKDALEEGYSWKEADQKDYRPQTCKVPDDIRDVSDEICKEFLACGECGKNYKIQSSELSFYKKEELPIPRTCPDCRHMERIRFRNKRILWDRQCDKCHTPIQSTYSPDRAEAVYCETCYLEHVY